MEKTTQQLIFQINKETNYFKINDAKKIGYPWKNIKIGLLIPYKIRTKSKAFRINMRKTLNNVRK